MYSNLDVKNNPIVLIKDIRFKGKRNINWNEVEKYVKEYVGSCYEVIETSDKIYIGSDFPNELKGSEDTKRLKGANAKAKANSTSELPMLLKIAKISVGRKISKINMGWMQNMGGIVLHLDLRCQYILIMEK